MDRQQHSWHVGFGRFDPCFKGSNKIFRKQYLATQCLETYCLTGGRGRKKLAHQVGRLIWQTAYLTSKKYWEKGLFNVSLKPQTHNQCGLLGWNSLANEFCLWQPCQAQALLITLGFQAVIPRESDLFQHLMSYFIDGSDNDIILT